jgi:plasmid segregation protein ParM
MRRAKPPQRIELPGGREFWVGLGAHEWGRPVENLDYERLSGAPEMRAILYASFTRYRQAYDMPKEPVTLYVGMPLEPLSGPRDEVKAMVRNVRKWLKGEHTWRADGGGFRLVVDKVAVTSQPTGAFFDYLIDDDGDLIPAHKATMKKEIGVISVGFNTVELLVIQNKRPVQRFSTGRTAGVRRLLELVDGNGLYSLGELDGQLREGALDTDEELPIWAREVMGQVEKTWGRAWRRFARVIVVGGGAILLRDHLSFAGRAYWPDQPVMAIARGLYKMGSQ